MPNLLSISLCVLVVFAATSCEAPPQHTGKRPLAPRSESDTRPRGSFEERVAAREATRGQEARAVAANEGIVGVGATHRYHLPDCAELADVSQSDRVLFVSPFDALDGAYHPCPVCRPGP